MHKSIARRKERGDRLYHELQSKSRLSGGAWGAHPRGDYGLNRIFFNRTVIPVVSEERSLGAVGTEVTSFFKPAGWDSSLAEGERYLARPFSSRPTRGTQTDAYCHALNGFHFPRHSERDRERDAKRNLRALWHARWRQGPRQAC